MSNKPRTIWVLFDLDNGHGDLRYLWYFKTRRAAREHRKWQAKLRNSARLSSPQKWIRQEEA